LPSPFASLNGVGEIPGIIFSGNSSPDFGALGGSASSANWKVGNSMFPEIYTPLQANVIKTSYEYLVAVAKKNELTALIDNLGTNNYCGAANNIGNCTLSPTLLNDIYIANGNLILTSNYTFPASKDYVILVNGNLTINGSITVPNSSTVTFSVKGDIIVGTTVGVLSSSTATSIEGFYSTDRNFIINGINDCDIGADRRLNIGGSIVTNAALLGGSLRNNRNLCADNARFPSLQITERPDFILNAPQFIQSSQTIWREVAP
jgi:hypothetical protein